MDKYIMKKKAWYLGTWRQSVLADNVIKQIQQLVARKKGNSVKLCMARDGIRVFVSNLLQGKVLFDHIPFTDLYFMTVNQHNPQCLLVIAKDPRYKYRIVAYRCENALDAGIFIQYYKDIRKSVSSVEGYNIELKRSNEGNWTLRSKQQEEDKRQLKTIVNMRTPTVQQNGNVQNADTKVSVMNGDSKSDGNKNSAMIIQTRVENSPPSPRTKVTLEKIYRKGKTQNNIGIQAAGTGVERYSDNVSETSESNQSFQNELNYLSTELREIKFMLEKSTGISAEVYYDRSGKEIQTESAETETEVQVIKALEPIDAIVKDEEEEEVVKLREVHNDDDDSQKIRVSVPDYRSLGVQASSKTLPPPPEKRSATLPASFRETQPDGPELLRASKTNYQSWRDDVVLRGRIGRSARPRTALYSTSSYTSTDGSMQGSLRGAPNGVHVHFDQAVPKGSVVYRKKAISTTVQKPIEKVYQRPHSVHSSSRPYVVHHHHHHGVPVYKTTVPTTLDLNQNKVNGVVMTNGHSPSSPRSSSGAGFFIRT